MASGGGKLRGEAWNREYSEGVDSPGTQLTGRAELTGQVRKRQARREVSRLRRELKGQPGNWLGVNSELGGQVGNFPSPGPPPMAQPPAKKPPALLPDMTKAKIKKQGLEGNSFFATIQIGEGQIRR